ncbi:Uncharacterised protein [Mycobacteroides abscessus subsp. abscessus]|nr:Uncharacterised protein [Mycobacteroides abscessus subsp. abscessus]
MPWSDWCVVVRTLGEKPVELIAPFISRGIELISFSIELGRLGIQLISFAVVCINRSLVGVVDLPVVMPSHSRSEGLYALRMTRQIRLQFVLTYE